MKRLKRFAISFVLVMAVATGGFVVWAQASRYPALPAAAQAAAAATHSPQGWLTFSPIKPNGTGFIFYPGALVDVEAYSPMAKALAEQGITVVIVDMPLDLAILNPNRASEVLTAYPDVQRWAIGGHSLGGSMAGQFLQSHPASTTKIRGLVMWASRLSFGLDVSSLNIQAISIYGTLDGLAPNASEAIRRVGMPVSTTVIAIQGGNHAMFGAYGPQQGDNTATIPSAESQQQIVSATATFLLSMK